jgi:hypothetical protein
MFDKLFLTALLDDLQSAVFKFNGKPAGSKSPAEEYAFSVLCNVDKTAAADCSREHGNLMAPSYSHPTHCS